MKIINIDYKNSLQIASDILLKGGIVIFPTDTVYGIGCILDGKTIKKLYRIKKRSFLQPTSILLTLKQYHNLRSSVKSGINIPDDMDKIFKYGEVTLILPISDYKIDFPKILIKNEKIGIRIPKHKWLEKLINKVGPIVASSANIAGEITPKKFNNLSDKILKKADLVISANEEMSGKSSAVYDLESGKYLRK